VHLATLQNEVRFFREGEYWKVESNVPDRKLSHQQVVFIVLKFANIETFKNH
jgi:hypothetical protein